MTFVSRVCSVQVKETALRDFCKLLGCLMLASSCLFSAFAQKQGETSVKTLDPVQGDQEAQKLVGEIFSQRPDQTYTNALLKIRSREGNERKVPVLFQLTTSATNWSAIYDASSVKEIDSPSAHQEEKRPLILKAIITHSDTLANQYLVFESGSTRIGPKKISAEETMLPFAGSDFWLADLGLEFLHWPKQRVSKKEMYSSRYCAVLDSMNPSPIKGGYARVRSWITTEAPHAPVRAEAYDSAGKRMKVFDVKSIEKVKGQFQVDAIEMRNLQTGSRTVMEFDLGND